MADSFVQVFPDSTGKQIDTDLIGGTKHRQRIRIGGAGLADLATVTNNRLDVNVQSSTDVPISVTHPGTGFDVATEESGGDGCIPLDGTDQTLVSFTVADGTTAYVKSIHFFADKKCTFRLLVKDGAATFLTKRLYTNTPEAPGSHIIFPVPIEVTGATGRTVQLIAKKTDPESDGIATGALNGYTI